MVITTSDALVGEAGSWVSRHSEGCDPLSAVGPQHHRPVGELEEVRRRSRLAGRCLSTSMSAFTKVERKGFEALLTAADAGKVDAIITRHQDRLTRHPETYGRVLEICVRHGILIHLCNGGVLDLATHAGASWG